MCLGKTQAQRGEAICPRQHKQEVMDCPPGPVLQTLRLPSGPSILLPGGAQVITAHDSWV